MNSLERIAAVLDARLASTEAEQRDEAHGGWLPGDGRRIRRLGLALESGDVPVGWLEPDGVDALLLHRPWGIAERSLPEGMGVLAFHRAFDACLTTGYNPALARALQLRDVVAFEEKDGRPLGMAGAFEAALRPREVLVRLLDVFGGLEAVHPPPRPVRRVVTARAMDDALVEAAHERGAALYVTGQMRTPGLGAVARTGIGVVATGHVRSERFGLRVLAGVLRRRFAALDVRVAGETFRES